MAVQSQPNIVFITCHDLGRHLGLYGQRTVSTPNLDRLAADGVVFDRSFCTAPQCSPSRSSLHTGRHAHSNGVMGLTHDPFNWRLHDDEQHIAARLRDAGYHTALFGIQHLTDRAHVHDLGYEVVAADHEPATRIAAAVTDYLMTEGQRQPFYLEVGFFEPHRPYDWHRTPPDDSKGVDLPPYIPDSADSRAEFAALQGMIQALDDGVGMILEALDQTGLAGNTWLVFTTDHGLAMPRAKCSLYDPGIETALMMRWPGGDLTGGRRVDALVSHVDVVPTLLDGLSLPLPDNLHGQSVWPLLRGDAFTPRDAIFAEKTFHTAYEPMRATRTTTHKLIVNFEVGPRVDVPDDIRAGRIYPQMIDQLAGHRPYVELYDLAADPGETVNRAGDPAYAAVETDLRARLLAWMRATDDPLLAGRVVSPFYRHVVGDVLGEGE